MRRIARAIGLLTLGILFSQPAFASPIRLQISNNGITFNIFDGILDLSPESGAVTYSGAVGNWEFNVTTGVGSDILSPLGHLDLISMNVNNKGWSNPGTLTIWFTELNIDTPYPNFTMAIGGTNNKTSVQYSAYYDNTNLYPTTALGASTGTAILMGCLPSCSTAYSSNGGFSGDLIANTSPGSMYSVSQKLEIKAISSYPGNNFSVDAELIPTPVPEPVSLLLLGTAFLAMGLGLKRLK